MKNEITKDAFVSILKEVGLSEAQMQQLHLKLEQQFPEDHEQLLCLLGISEEERNQIRNC